MRWKNSCRNKHVTLQRVEESRRGPDKQKHDPVYLTVSFSQPLFFPVDGRLIRMTRPKLVNFVNGNGVMIKVGYPTPGQYSSAAEHLSVKRTDREIIGTLRRRKKRDSQVHDGWTARRCLSSPSGGAYVQTAGDGFRPPMPRHG